MNQNLDTLRDEMLQHLKDGGFAVFQGDLRVSESTVQWDTRRAPDFREFLATAAAAGAKPIVFHCEEFTHEQADEAIEDLEVAQLTEEEYRGLSRRLKELREYDGFTCLLELSFDQQGRTYLFHLRTDWFNEFLNIRNDIDDAFPEGDDQGEEPMGGYFSRN